MSNIINPFCHRCGKMSRRYGQLNRRHLGNWLHGVCNCCVELDCNLLSARFFNNPPPGFPNVVGSPPINCCWNTSAITAMGTMPTPSPNCTNSWSSFCSGTHEFEIFNSSRFESASLGQFETSPGVFTDVTKQLNFSNRGGGGKARLVCALGRFDDVGAEWISSGFDCNGSTSSPYIGDSPCYPSTSGFSFSITDNTCCYDESLDPNNCVFGTPDPDGSCQGI